ncbi:hypothetical protein LPJ59_002787 [Coemansia sp. RSA 2399]|nr:hypothetical protein LPJ59_002787 [Coemansia sp. RSA 2399]
MSKATEVEQVPPPVETSSGDFVYYVRQGNSGSLLYCRRSAVSESVAREQVLVDTEDLAKVHGFILRHLVVSDDHHFIGCLASKSDDSDKGAETSCLIIYSLNDTGETRHLETLENVFNFVFGLNGTLFYTVLNEKLRAWRVYGHQIGKYRSEDACVYTETNDECFVDITRTKDKRFHIVNSSALDSSELYIFDSKHDFWTAAPAADDDRQTQTSAPLSLVRPRQKGVEYFVDHHDGEFVILTNSPKVDKDSKKQITDPLPFRLVRAPTSHPSSKHWTDLLRVADDERIEDVEIFKDFIMITIKRKGYPAVLIYDRNRQSFSELSLPYEGLCTVRPDSNPQFDASTIRLCFSSPVHLDSVVRYDMRSLKQIQSWSSTPLHIDPSQYKIQRVNARNENTNVPMTVIRHKHTTPSEE